MLNLLKVVLLSEVYASGRSIDRANLPTFEVHDLMGNLRIAAPGDFGPLLHRRVQP
jgi:hypothetical protein